ncbi:MAG TPA: DUF481 domain-containing protein [Methylomirabilota bacterium]|nr:DUF481 domain-containing protein [Methylomirabilota bacterium]
MFPRKVDPIPPRFRHGLWLALVLSSAVAPPEPAAADAPQVPVVLHLKNGDRLSGHVLDETPDRIVLTNAVLGIITVARTNLAVASNAARPPDGAGTQVITGHVRQRQQALLELYRRGTITPAEYHHQRRLLLSHPVPDPPETNVVVASVPAAAAGGPSPPPSRPASVTAKPAPLAPGKWHGEALIGLDFAVGERDRELLTGRLKLNFTDRRLRNTLDYLFTYGRTDAELSANRMDGSMKTDYEFHSRLYAYNLGGAGYDEIRRIDLRFEEGPGGGIHLIRGTNWTLRAEYGFNYQAYFYQNGTDSERFHHRYAQEFWCKPNARLIVDEKLEFFPTWGNWQNYRLRLEVNARFSLNTWLSFVLTLLDQYDTDPPNQVSRNDLQLRSSLGVKF